MLADKIKREMAIHIKRLNAVRAGLPVESVVEEKDAASPPP
jgi:hypothetical protein